MYLYIHNCLKPLLVWLSDETTIFFLSKNQKLLITAADNTYSAIVIFTDRSDTVRQEWNTLAFIWPLWLPCSAQFYYVSYPRFCFNLPCIVFKSLILTVPFRWILVDAQIYFLLLCFVYIYFLSRFWTFFFGPIMKFIFYCVTKCTSVTPWR